MGVQKYLPIQEKRDLAPVESQAVQQGLSQWFPKLFPSYGTPVVELLASPAKSAILGGGIMALATGALGFLQGAKCNKTAALFALGGAALGGIMSYFSRQQSNENILDLMKRLPSGATKRDLLSDPAYQADLNRQAMMMGNRGDFSSGLLAGALVSSTFRPTFKNR
jgi:hypothetical protein